MVGTMPWQKCKCNPHCFQGGRATCTKIVPTKISLVKAFILLRSQTKTLNTKSGCMWILRCQNTATLENFDFWDPNLYDATCIIGEGLMWTADSQTECRLDLKIIAKIDTQRCRKTNSPTQCTHCVSRVLDFLSESLELCGQRKRKKFRWQKSSTKKNMLKFRGFQVLGCPRKLVKD